MKYQTSSCVSCSRAFPYPQEDSSVCVCVCVCVSVMIDMPDLNFQLAPNATILFVIVLLFLNYCKPLACSVMTRA